MAKNKKTRHCPAVDRDIKAAECGANRNSRYACPADCEHNPLAPANYDQLLELDGRINPKCMEFLFGEPDTGEGCKREFRRLLERRAETELHAFVATKLFFETDAQGRTAMERWRDAGFSDLKNDERALVGMKMGTRIALPEVHRVLDSERVEAVDLLEDAPQPFLIIDRSLASFACRFTVALAWVCEMPHFHRISGALIAFPDLDDLEPAFIVEELAAHLGAPSEPAELRRWLAFNFKRVDEALHATHFARRHATLDATDAEFCKASYTLVRPVTECLAVLDEVEDVKADDLSDEEFNSGFTRAFAWFEDADTAALSARHFDLVVWGRILLGPDSLRIEATGGKRFDSFREEFEERLADRVQFESERREDLAAQMRMEDPAFDESLVPPSLLENVQSLLFATSRIPAADESLSEAELKEKTFRAQEETWLDESIPMFNGMTPREAAKDASTRSRLLRTMKNRIRSADERNLEEGGNLSLDWIIEELGLDEIGFDPPPPRFDGDVDESFDDFDTKRDRAVDVDLPPAPRLPLEPLTEEEVRKRMQAAFGFDTATDAAEQMGRCGSMLLEDADSVLEDELTDEEFGPLANALIAVWYALVPPGHQIPVWNDREFKDAFTKEIDRLAQLPREEEAWAEGALKSFKEGPQPHVAFAAMNIYFEACDAMLPKTGKKCKTSPLALACIKAGIVVIDDILRDTAE